VKDLREEWDDASRPWVDFVRAGKDHYRDGLNNPAAFELIGAVRGKRVLDLACGEGYNTRILAAKGAEVTGVDFSEEMIDAARREEARLQQGIRYYVLDAAYLDRLRSGRFDLVTCFMSLQDVEDYRKAVSEVSRVLKTRGRFVFSIPHPCFETIVVKGKRVSAGERYFDPLRYPIHWNMPRLGRPFRTSSFHRTLTDYVDALFRNGLLVLRLVEPTPTVDGLQEYPALEQCLKRPQSVIIESVKTLRIWPSGPTRRDLDGWRIAAHV
jgi:SAM-dependent methyltransferase